RLALHAEDRFLIRRDARGKDLDRDRTAEPRILGFPHFSHAARAEAIDELIRAELLTGSHFDEYTVLTRRDSDRAADSGQHHLSLSTAGVAGHRAARI